MCAYPQLQLVITLFLEDTFQAVSIFRFEILAKFFSYKSKKKKVTQQSNFIPTIIRLNYLNELIGN